MLAVDICPADRYALDLSAIVGNRLQQALGVGRVFRGVGEIEIKGPRVHQCKAGLAATGDDRAGAAVVIDPPQVVLRKGLEMRVPVRLVVAPFSGKLL